MWLPSEVQHAHSDKARIPPSQVPHLRAIPINSLRLVLLLYTAHVCSCKLAYMYKSGALSRSTSLGKEVPLA